MIYGKQVKGFRQYGMGIRCRNHYRCHLWSQSSFCETSSADGCFGRFNAFFPLSGCVSDSRGLAASEKGDFQGQRPPVFPFVYPGRSFCPEQYAALPFLQVYPGRPCHDHSLPLSGPCCVHHGFPQGLSDMAGLGVHLPDFRGRGDSKPSFGQCFPQCRGSSSCRRFGIGLCPLSYSGKPEPSSPYRFQPPLDFLCASYRFRGVPPA